LSSVVPPHTPEVIPWSNAQANARAVNETNHQDSVMTSHMPGGKPGSVVKAGDLVAELIWADEVLLDPNTLERSCVHLQNGDCNV